MAGADKRLFKSIVTEPGTSPHDLQALSPPQGTAFAQSPSRAYSRSQSDDGEQQNGLLCDTISRKTLFYLISTLNASFQPDYDFSQARSDEFSKEPSLNWVTNAIDSNMFATANQTYGALRSQLWSALDNEICLGECDIYSYNPDLDSDPFGEDGCLWSFNYFFYNKKLKRIVFFTCRAVSLNFNAFCGKDSDLAHNLSMDLDDDDIFDNLSGYNQPELSY